MFVTGFASAQQRWESYPKICNEDIYKCFFVDSSYGWVIADSGQIIATTNSGNNWVVQKKLPSISMVDIYFRNAQTGWAVGWIYDFINFGTYIYSTTNGGNYWSSYLLPDTTLLVNSIYFLNQNTGFIGCASAPERKIYITTDGGINWTVCGIDSSATANFPVRNIRFLNQNTGFAVGGFIDINGVLWKTTNGGQYWHSYSLAPEPFNYISIWDSNHILAAGGDYEFGISIIRSSNSGNNWTYNPTSIFGIGMSISHRTVRELWVPSGFSQSLIVSTDGGMKFETYPTPDSSTINCLLFTDSLHGFAVGTKGSFLKYTPSPVGIGNEGITKVEDFHLYPNYPNPFNSSTIINYSLSIPSYITITIYDVSGRKIEDIYHGIKNSGKYSIRYDMKDYSSGIYFYSITSKSLLKGNIISRTGKMILIK